MEEVAGTVTVEVPGRGRGVSEHSFSYQVPICPAPPICRQASLVVAASPLGCASQQAPHLRASLSASGSFCASVSDLTPVCSPIPNPIGPKGAVHLPSPRPQSRGYPPHPAWLQTPDGAA